MLKNMMTTGGICCLLFLILETLCRAAGFYSVNSDFKPVIKSEKLGWQLKPNYRALWQELEWRVPYETNSSGFRDQERSLVKQPGIGRILTLGGSFAEGYGVAVESMWQTQLAGFLQEQGPVEMINMGVRGYDILQEYQQFLHFGISYEPDVIIQILNDSNFHSSEWTRMDAIGRSRPRYEIVSGSLRFLPVKEVAPQIRLQGALIQSIKKTLYRSAFCVWLRRKWEQAFWKWTDPRRLWDRMALGLTQNGRGQPSSEYAQNYTEAIRIVYQRMVSIARAKDAKFLVVWVSSKPMPSRVAIFFDELGIEHTAVLLNPEDRFRYDSHPHCGGHKKIAKAIRAFMGQNIEWRARLSKV